MKRSLPLLALLLAGVSGLAADRGDAPSAERGRDALFHRAFNPAIWTRRAYDNAWSRWGVAAKPERYEEAFAERYGLHPAPFDNKGLPMGLQESDGLFGKGITNSCLVCHGGSILGKSYVGLGNASLDMQLLYEELAAAEGRRYSTPFPFTNVRGTTEAGAMAVFLLRLRDKDLRLRPPLEFTMRTDLCEDPPAWWLLKKKQTMYHVGSTPARSVRSLMQFALSPLTPTQTFKSYEPAFADMQAYLLSLEAPKYPLAIDHDLAARGRPIFENRCAKCHGTYGANGTYPNEIIDLDVIGTDPTRALGFDERLKDHYNATWFGEEKGPDGTPYQSTLHRGYQAPPLDGVWATAPYFHNGSVPTLYHVLNSRERPKRFTRSYRTGLEDYDQRRVGWKVQPADARTDLPPIEARKIYDTAAPGRGNGGHTFGDDLTEDERWAVIEYLKTL